MNNLKLTKLHQNHMKLNAKMVPFANFMMPLQYSNIRDEFTQDQVKKSLVIARSKILEMHQILNPPQSQKYH